VQLYLVRHTRVAVGPGLCYGQKDVPLAETADADIARTLALIPNQVDAVFSSPLSRCVKLANSLAPRIRADIQIDYDLQELNFGSWEGLLWNEIPRAEIDAWAQDFAVKGPPLGESFFNLSQRIARALERMQASKAEHVVCVTHGGVIRAFLCMALGLPPSKAFDFEVDYGSLTHLKWPAQGTCRIVGTNRTS
jgi:alpha-ribazole phosphatase